LPAHALKRFTARRAYSPRAFFHLKFYDHAVWILNVA
jgi:hypothetical protein